MNDRNKKIPCFGCGDPLPAHWAHAGVHPECESQVPSDFVMPREPSRDENRRLMDWDNRVLQLSESIASLSSDIKRRTASQVADLAQLTALTAERSHVTGLIRSLTARLDAVTS